MKTLLQHRGCCTGGEESKKENKKQVNDRSPTEKNEKHLLGGDND